MKHNSINYNRFFIGLNIDTNVFVISIKTSNIIKDFYNLSDKFDTVV